MTTASTLASASASPSNLTPHQPTTSSAHMDATALRAELTDKYSTKRFAMEYGGYLSNHLLHGAVALFEIGASKEQIEAFATHYAAEKLEAVASDHVDPFHVETVEATDASSTIAIPDHERLDALLGQREDFDALLAFYGHEVQLLGADAAIQKHLPTLAAGLCGALLHGLIQLGYAYHIGGDRLIAEGLAYWHFSYLSFEQPAPDSSSDSANKTPTQAFTRAAAMDAIDALQQQEAFVLSEMHQQLEQPAIAELSLGLFQRKLNAISAHPERGSAAAFERIASALNAFDLSEVNSDVALDFALWLYVMIAHNDFVIAHAVTSAWSLQQLEHLLTPLDRNRAWRVWLHVAVSAFVLQQVRDLHTNDICEHAQLELRTLDEWPTIVAQALALENGTDEHVYKVVQVASEHAGWRAAAASDHGMELGVAKRSTSHRRSSFLTADEREFVTRKAASKVVTLKFEGI